jgi:hypothetical protein
MITLTAPDGTAVSIDAELVVRARRTISGERGGEGGDAQTRVDWEITQLVTEPIDTAAALIKAELSSFTSLTTSDGSKIWFDAKKATGPLPVTSSQKQGGVKSSIKIMGYRQYVTETPPEVRTVIANAGGTPV